MPAATLEAPAAVAELEGGLPQLNRIQKLAALLVILGPESASHILRQFEPQEIEAITMEMAKFSYITQELQEDILAEFSDVAVEAATSVAGGTEIVRHTLEKAVGTFRATDIMGRVAPAARPVPPAMNDIADLDGRHLFNLLRLEQAQTIAFVLSFLPAQKASQVLTLLAPGQREQVVARLATLAPTPFEVAEQVLKVLNASLGTRQTRPLNQSGGVTTAADILNAMDKKLSRALLESLDGQNAEIAGAIREKMFTFEDLVMLGIPTLQRILREVDTHDLALSLKKCSEKLSGLLFSAISKRASDTVREEMEFIGNPKPREIEAAQQRIITLVRQLESDGEVDLEEARRGTANA